MMDIHATPAYGRDYKSAQAVINDWKAGKDFHGGVHGYLSIRDADKIRAQVWVRYSDLTKIVRVH
jgi:hypothetical protein